MNDTPRVDSPDPELVPCKDLRIGDEYWGDTWSHDMHHPLFGEKCIWTVVKDPITSINTGLFDGNGVCVVVAVEYADASRGSRLWDESGAVRIRRA